jgi:hypothetical protein
MGTLDVLLQNGAFINAIHRGEGVRALSRNQFFDFPIPAVEPTKSITLNKVGELFAERVNEPITEATILINSPTTVRMQHLQGFDSLAFRYTFEVVEFGGPVSVQRGVQTLNPPSNSFIDIPIQPVDLTKSMLLYRLQEVNRVNHINVRMNAFLVNGSNIRIFNRQTNRGTINIQWEVLTID